MYHIAYHIVSYHISIKQCRKQHVFRPSERLVSSGEGLCPVELEVL